MSTASDSELWHVQQGDSSFGPLTHSEICSLISRGVIKGGTMLSNDGRTWMRASDAFSKQVQGNGAAAGGAKGAERWYWQAHDGTENGPVSFTELLSCAMNGNLSANSLVRQEQKTQWQRAEDVFPHLGTKLSKQVEPVRESTGWSEPQIDVHNSKSNDTWTTRDQEILAGIVAVSIGILAVIFLPPVIKWLGPTFFLLLALGRGVFYLLNKR